MNKQVSNQMSRNTTKVLYKTAVVEGLSIFYREAGDPGKPKLLLLHGFPASSHQYRNLISALSDRFHIIAPDYPGFGNSDMPSPDKFDYTFDRLSEIIEGFLKKIGFTDFGLYMQDYGGPVGFRIISLHPDWLEWLIIQNANTYEVGFTSAWDGLRNLWKNRSPETEKPLFGFLQLDVIKQVYLHGHKNPELICSTTTALMSYCIQSGKSPSASTSQRPLSSGGRMTSSLLQREVKLTWRTFRMPKYIGLIQGTLLSKTA
jgi:pimeloyl-ACP methyl ester carboxylesterase